MPTEDRVTQAHPVFSTPKMTSALRHGLLLTLLLLLASCSSEPTVAQKITSLLVRGDVYTAEVQLDRAEREGSIDAAQLRELRAAIPEWKAAHQRAELRIVDSLQNLDERGAYRELDNLIDRLDDDPRQQRALRYQLRRRWSYWVKEAPTRPRIVRAEDLPQQGGGQLGGANAEPQARVSEGSEDVFGAAAYKTLSSDIRSKIRERRYGEAMQMLRELLPVAGGSADTLRDLLWEVEDKAQLDMDEVLARVAALEGEGKLKSALALARMESEHFPDSGRFAKLVHAAEDIVRRIEYAKAPPPPSWVTGPKSGAGASGSSGASGAGQPNPVSREGRVAAAIAAGDRRDYAKAASLFEGLANELQSANPRLHSLYRTEADEARLVAFAKESVIRALEQPKKAAVLRSVPAGRGRTGNLLAADTEKLRFEIEGVASELEWSSLSDSEFVAILEKAVDTPLEQLGLAVLLFRIDQSKEAEKQLKHALRRDKTTKPLLDRILAKARQEPLREGGYVLDRGEFIAYETKMRRELESSVHKLVERALRARNDEQRDKVLAEALEKGSVAEDLVKEDLLAKRKELLAAIEKTPVKSSLGKLIEMRKELDKRRRHALELIYDTEKYFYPYKPPAVSGEKAKMYAEVQAEVDRRVQAVQDIWDGKGISVAVSGALKKQLDLLRWVQEELKDTLEVDLGESTDADRLVSGRGISIRNVAIDAGDQRYMDYWAQITDYNTEKLAEWVRDKKITRGQSELVRYTNEYRMMMGRHPLKVDLRVMKAAQGHTDEMSTMGYFSHYSPTQGRRTPQDRMKLEGYPNPGGENLAINSGPETSVWAWRHSSGHHRNMLGKGHGDIGTGVSGRYFAQNFGGGNGRWR
jgi:uncharacterized protein YkwD